MSFDPTQPISWGDCTDCEQCPGNVSLTATALYNSTLGPCLPAIVVAWMNAFDMSTIPGGNTHEEQVNATCGFSEIVVDVSNGNCSRFDNSYVSGASGNDIYCRSITNVASGTNYMILEIDVTSKTVVAGCTHIGGGQVQIPVPPPNSDITVYILGIVGSANYSVNPNISPNLSDFAANFSTYNAYSVPVLPITGSECTIGGGFDSSMVCANSPADPFS